MSSFQSRRPLMAVLIVIGAILTVGAARRRRGADARRLQPLPARLRRHGRHGSARRHLAGQRLGPERVGHLTVVDVEQQVEHSTLYTGLGSKNATVVTVAGGPTGTVANSSTTDFAVSQRRRQRSLVASSSTRWRPDPRLDSTVNATNAVVAVDNSVGGAVYTGLATANDRLYAADFHNARVDSFDASFKPLGLPFKDPKHRRRAGRRSASRRSAGTSSSPTRSRTRRRRSAVPGGGNGYVDEFTPDGTLVARVASKGKPTAPLNAPWGLAMAPANFGAYSGDLLVGNFGNGRISAYQLRSTDDKWVYKGQVRVGRAAGRSRSTASGRSPSATAPSAGPTNNLYFRPARPAGARPVRLHRRRLSSTSC